MKQIVITYNFLTLCRALKYTNDVWGKENTQIIYMNLISDMPLKISEDYEIITIDCDGLDKKRGFSLIFYACISAKKLLKICENILASSDELFEIVCFRDNEVQEATVIDKILKKFRERVHFTLIEEGAGLYAKIRFQVRFRRIKAVIYRLLGVSLYSLESKPQGLNPSLSKIICTNPLNLKDKTHVNISIEKMIDVFTSEFSEYIVSTVVENRDKYESYDYVFLTQPFTDFRSDYDDLLIKHKKLLPIMFNVLKKHGKTIIKPHPREVFDYSVYESDKIDMVDDHVKALPFECLMHLYGYPQIISMYSSASINVNTKKAGVFMGKAFDIPNIDTLFDTQFYERNNIVLCDSIDDLENFLE